MANFSPNISLELPTSPEHYDIGVFNKNNMVIDSEINKLNIKNQSQDEILTAEVSRATNKENELTEILNGEILRATNAEETINGEIENISENVNNIHVHNNKSTLDKISESDSGTLLFDGKEFGGESDITDDISDMKSNAKYTKHGVEAGYAGGVDQDSYPVFGGNWIDADIEIRKRFYILTHFLESLVARIKSHTHGNMKSITYSTTEPTTVADGEIVMVYEE